MGVAGVSAAARPSGPRVTMWRKLRRLGVAQVLDGLVALPADAGRGSSWSGWPMRCWRPVGRRGRGSAVSARRPRSGPSLGGWRTAVAADYEAVLAEAAAGGGESEVVRRRMVARLRRELQRIGRRDDFPPHGARGGAGAVEDLAATVAADEVGDTRRGACRPSGVLVAGPPICRSGKRCSCSSTIRTRCRRTRRRSTCEGWICPITSGDCTFETMSRRFELDDPVLWMWPASCMKPISPMIGSTPRRPAVWTSSAWLVDGARGRRGVGGDRGDVRRVVQHRRRALLLGREPA